MCMYTYIYIYIDFFEKVLSFIYGFIIELENVMFVYSVISLSNQQKRRFLARMNANNETTFNQEFLCQYLNS